VCRSACFFLAKESAGVDRLAERLSDAASQTAFLLRVEARHGGRAQFL
jgi:hypothetical protein